MLDLSLLGAVPLIIVRTFPIVTSSNQYHYTNFGGKLQCVFKDHFWSIKFCRCQEEF
ncbi:hypothetical protein [Escherichia phage Es2]|nr:hypothetical protein [Escherichia phage Es2]